ncbi:MFS transporter [Microbispora sp. NBRC 16548]|uniref:MFS transporter n=1 Tax=Microbispora sp. NBRC 16548 TaxID=3030994 RepID=UPI0024A35EFF|nr:MFS transporter [Microbispora sp. NBRC 16548]GLX11695.1 MFS transporter [Microbispora sp. NBRC 16548]
MRDLLRESRRPHRVREHPYAPWFAVGAVCIGAFMGQLDASIVTLAFPALEGEFGASLAAVQWVSLGYLLVLVALLAGAGRLADVAGRKLVYLYGFVVFTVASAACGLAPSLAVLVACRLVQAAGAAMLQANSVALVVSSVPRARMRAGLGMQAAAQALGLALGPALGGVLVATAGWRWVFWINVPVGCAALIAGRYLLPRTRQRGRGGRFDWQGLVLLGASTSALLLAASVISGLELPSWSVPVLLTVAAGAAIGFWRWEARVPSALIDTALLRNRVVTAGLSGALGGYLVLFGPLVLIPQILVAGGTGELVAGLVLTALPGGFAVSALMGDHLLPRAWGDRRRCVVGAVAAAAGCALLAADPAAEGWAGACLALTGAGLGLFVPANNTVVMAAVPERVAATAGGMVNMARGIGTALGIAAVTLALHLAGDSHEAGARAAPAVLAAVALLAALTASGRVVRPGAGPYPGRS